MPEKDGSLGLGGLSSALGNGTPAFHRSSHTAMITTGSGRATDNPASMSTVGDGTRALQGGVRGSRSNTTATADAAMRANRRNGNLTNSGALRAANGFATVAAKLETAINRQSAMIEKQTDQIIVRLETLNKTMITMSEMYQKVNNVAIAAYDEQIKAQQKTLSNFFSKIFKKDYFGYVDKLSVPWSRQNSNALNVTIPRAIAQFDKNVRAVSAIMTMKLDKFETVLEDQLLEAYRHNTRSEELLEDLTKKFNVYFKMSSSQREAIGLSANHIQNTADHFFLNTDVYRGRLVKELNGMTNHFVDQFVEIMDNVTEQLSGAASYIIGEMEPMLNNMAEKLILGPKFAKGYNRAQFASPSMDRSRIKSYKSAKAVKPNFKSNAPSKDLTGWITEFYRADASRYRDLYKQLQKVSNKMKIDEQASAEEFSKAFANMFNINTNNPQSIQNMLSLITPASKTKGGTVTGEDIAANLLASMGFGSDIYKNTEFQKRLLEKFGVKYNANRPTHVSTLNRSIQNKVKKNDITIDDLMKIIGGDAKNANQIVSNIAESLGIKDTGSGFKKLWSKSVLHKEKDEDKKNNKQRDLDNKAKQALMVLGGIDSKDKKAKNASVEALQRSIMGSVGAVNASTETVKHQTKFSERLIGALKDTAKTFAAASLKSLITTGLKMFALFRTASALFGGMRWVKNNPIFKSIGGFINEWIWTPAKKYLIDPLVSGIKSLMVKYIPPEIMEKISKVTDSVVGFVSKWGGITYTAMLSDDPQERRNARSQILTGIGSVLTGVLNKYLLPTLWKIARYLSLAFMGWKMMKAGAAKVAGAVASTAKKTADSFVYNKIGSSPFWESFADYYMGTGSSKNVAKAAAKPTGSFLGSAAKLAWKGAKGASKLAWKGSKAAYKKIASTQTGQAMGSIAKTAWNNATAGVVSGFNDLKAAYTKWAQNGGAKKLIKSVELDALHLFNRARHKLFDPKGLIGSKIPAAKKIFSSMQTSVLNVFNNIKKKMFDIKGMIMPKLLSAKSIFESIANGALNIFNDIKKKMFDPNGAIGSKVTTALNKVKGFWSNWVHEQQKTYFMSPEVRMLGEGVDKIKNNKYVKGAFNYVKGSKVGKAVSGAVTKAMGYVKSTKIGGAVVSALAGKSMAGAATTVLGSLVGLIGKAAALVTPVGIGLAIAAAGGWLIKKIIDCVFKPAADKEAVDSKDAKGVGTAVCRFVSESVSKFFSSASSFLDEYGGFVGLVKMFFSGMGGIIKGIWHAIAKAVGSETDGVFSVIGNLALSIAKGVSNLINDIYELLWDGIKAIGNAALDAAKGVFHFLTFHLFDDSEEEKEAKKAKDWYENSVKDLFKKDENLKAELEKRSGGNPAKMDDLALMEKILGSGQVSRMKEVSQSKENRDIASNYRFFEERERKLAEREAKEKEKQQKEKEEELEDQGSFRDNVSSGLDSIKNYFNSGKLKKDITSASEKLGGFLKDTFNSIKNFDYAGVGNSIIEGAGGFTANFLSGIMGESETYDFFSKLEKIGAEEGYTELTRFAQKGKHTIASDITNISRFTGESTDRLKDILNVLREGVANGWTTEEEAQRLAKNYIAGKSAREDKPKTEKKETTKTTVTETTNTIVVAENAAKQTKKTTTTSTATTATTTQVPTFATGSTTKTESPTSISGSASTASSSKPEEKKGVSDEGFWERAKNEISTIKDTDATIKGSGGLVGLTKRIFGFDSTPNRGTVSGKPISPVKSGALTIESGQFASGTVYASGLIIPSKYKNNVRLSGTYGERMSNGDTNPGINISKYPNDKGAIPTVIAPIGGVVKHVGAFAGLGRTVLLTHDINGQKYTTLYGHLASFAEGLKVGDTIAAGDLIGYMGTSDAKNYNMNSVSDNAYPRELHFAVAKGTNPPINYASSMDPVKFLNLVYSVRNAAGTTTVPAGGDLVGYETAEYTASKAPKTGLAAIGEKSTELGSSAVGMAVSVTGEILKRSAVPLKKSKLDENIDKIFETEYFKNMTDAQKQEAYYKIHRSGNLRKQANKYGGWFSNDNAIARDIFNEINADGVKEEEKITKEQDPMVRHLRSMLIEGGLRGEDVDKYIKLAQSSDKFMDAVKASTEKYNARTFKSGEFGAGSRKLVENLREAERTRAIVDNNLPSVLGNSMFNNLSEEDKAKWMSAAYEDEEMQSILKEHDSKWFKGLRTGSTAKRLNEVMIRKDIERARDEAKRSNKPEEYTDAVMAQLFRLQGVREEDITSLIEASRHNESIMAAVEEAKKRFETGEPFKAGELSGMSQNIFRQAEMARTKQQIRSNNINKLLNDSSFDFFGDKDQLRDLMGTNETMAKILDRYENETFYFKSDARKDILNETTRLGLEKFRSKDHTENIEEDTNKYLYDVLKASNPNLSDEEIKKEIESTKVDVDQYLYHMFKDSDANLSDEEIQEKINVIKSSKNARELAITRARQFSSNDTATAAKGAYNIVEKEIDKMLAGDKTERERFLANIPAVLASSEFKGYSDADKTTLTELMWYNQEMRKKVAGLNSFKTFTGIGIGSLAEEAKKLASGENEEIKPVDTAETAEVAEEAAANGEEGTAGSGTKKSKGVTVVSTDIKYMNAISDLFGDSISKQELPETLKIIKDDSIASALLDEYINKSEEAGGNLDASTKLYYTNNISSILKTVKKSKAKTVEGGLFENRTTLPIADHKSITGDISAVNASEVDSGSILNSTKFRKFNSDLAYLVGIDSYKKIDDTLKQKLFEEPSVYSLVSGCIGNNANTKDLIIAAEKAGIHMSTVFNDPEYQQLYEMLRRSEDVQGPVMDQAQLDAAERSNKLTEKFGNDINDSLLDVYDVAKYNAGVDTVSAIANMNNSKSVVYLNNYQVSNGFGSFDAMTGGGGGPSGGGGFGGAMISKRQPV